MKKIFTLAIIAMASVAMVACCGQAEKKAEVAEPAATEVVCDKNCAECEKAKECPQAQVETPAEAPVQAPAETPAK